MSDEKINLFPRISKWIPKLSDKAAESHIVHQHAAMLLVNGTPNAFGVNSIRGARPYHAESDVIRSYLINRGLIGWVREHRILWGSRQCKKPKGAEVYSSPYG